MCQTNGAKKWGVLRRRRRSRRLGWGKRWAGKSKAPRSGPSRQSVGTGSEHVPQLRCNIIFFFPPRMCIRAPFLVFTSLLLPGSHPRNCRAFLFLLLLALKWPYFPTLACSNRKDGLQNLPSAPSTITKRKRKHHTRDS